MADTQTIKGEQAPQPSPGTGRLTGAMGRWTEAGILRLRGIDPNAIEFHRGPIGFSVLWQGRPIGRINVYAHLGTCTANLKGHEFWVPPNKVIRSWHYNPGLAVPDATSAKAAVKRVLADARMLLYQTPGADAAEGDPIGPRP